MTESVHVIPQPVSLKTGEGKFHLGDTTSIISGDGCSKVEHLASELFHLDLETSPSRHSLKLTLETDSTPTEGYTLTVTPDQINIVSSDERGLSYGLQTLRQLMPSDQITNRTETVLIPVVTIQDHPKFQWRGQHLDVCRHFFPVDFVKKYIDLLAFHKCNIFHWHLTEDQGWRIAIDKYPKLQEISAWRSESPLLHNRLEMDGIPYGGFYSKDEIRDVVEYAASRFITIMPEIELPGHTIAVLAAYPDLGCRGKDYKVRTVWGVEDDVFCAGNDRVFEFLENVLDEVLELFPDSEYIHVGGDECPKVRWAECPKCQARIKDEGLANEEELQSWFISKIGNYLHRKGRKMIGWDEILEGGLPPGAAVMSWRGTEGGIEAASAGNQVVMSPTSHCYFDYYQTDDRDNEPPAFPLMITLEQCYTFDPHQGVPASFHEMVMGGQSNTWTEYISTMGQVEYQQYPRGCALAETLWTPLPEGGRDFHEFLVRLRTHLQRLDKLGVNFRIPKEHLGPLP